MDDNYCRWCEKKINFKKDKWTCLNTYVGKEALDINNFHFQCFMEWFKKRLEEKSLALYNRTMKDIMPQVSGMVNSLVKEIQ